MSLDVGDHRHTRDLDQQNFGRIARVMREETGIELPESKLPLVQARLQRRIRVLHLKSFGAYCDVIEKGGNDSERLKMVSALTTNVTSFFREMHHFDYIRQNMMSEMASRLKMGKSVRVWSAGCSSGEEPYSLALTFAEAIPDIARYDFKILATDIDPVILKSAFTGIYPIAALSDVSEKMRKTYFQPDPTTKGRVQVTQDLKDLIAFRRLNLIGEWPIKRKFDIVMCRNVVIYFGETTKREIWTRLVNQVGAGGVLCTGHSERLSGPAAKEMELVGTTTYRASTGDGATERTTRCH